MLPLGFLIAAKGQPTLVELKDGTTLNGLMFECDQYMNVILQSVIQTNQDATEFTRLEEVFARGNNIKYLRLPDEVAETIETQQKAAPGGGRGGRGREDGRGRGRGGGGRGGRGGGGQRGGRGS